MTFHPTTSPLRMFLKRLAIRSPLSGEERRAILNMQCRLVDVRAHTDIVRLGEHTDFAFLIISGLVARYSQNKAGQRQTTALHIPGDMPDLASTVCRKAGWALQALVPSTLARVPHGELRRVAADHPAVAEAFWRDTVVDGSIFSDWVVNVGQRVSRVRLAHFLCEMGLRFEHMGLGTRKSFPLRINQIDLGEALGITSVHTNRTMQELRETKLVTFGSSGIEIHDWDMLAKRGEFDPAYLLADSPAQPA